MNDWKQIESKKYSRNEIFGIITVIIALIGVLSGIALLTGFAGTQSVILGLILVYSTLEQGYSTTLFGLLIITFGITFGYVGYKMYKGFDWAYNIYVIMVVFSFFMSIVLHSIVGLAVATLVLIYLYSWRVGDF